MGKDKCRNCGIWFNGRTGQTSCSRWCAVKSRNQTASKNPNWKGGVFSKEKGRKYRSKYPEKDVAHRAVRSAIRTGALKKEPCWICGTSKRIEAHHEDYSKPLAVTWVCKNCHMETHRNLVLVTSDIKLGLNGAT